jgi:hypothetical protein
MKKKLFLILFIFLTSANLTFAADKVKIMNMDISDLMVKGFEFFDVSVDNSKVYYTLKMKVLDDKMVKYPPVILCGVSLKDLHTACLDIN